MRIFSLVIFLLFAGTAIAQTQSGKASYYANKFQGRPTASGTPYDARKFTAAHRSLPFGTHVKVTNLKNEKSIVVEVNDRGPFVKNRIIDLSYAAAKSTGIIKAGVADVSIEVVTINDNVGDQDEPSFYQIEVTKLRPTGFGVQIMSFAQMDNYVAFVEDLQETYKKEDILLQSKTVKGQKVHAIILGQYKTREGAVKLQESLLKSYPDCYVIDFSKFK